MLSSVNYRRFIAIWLSAILLVFSVVASAHDFSHVDDGANTHCTVCFHQQQLNDAIPPASDQLALISQSREQFVTQHSSLYLAHRLSFRSRAPPLSL